MNSAAIETNMVYALSLDGEGQGGAPIGGDAGPKNVVVRRTRAEMGRHVDGPKSKHPTPSKSLIIKGPGHVIKVAKGDVEEAGGDNGENVGGLGGTGGRFRVLAKEDETEEYYQPEEKATGVTSNRDGGRSWKTAGSSRGTITTTGWVKTVRNLRKRCGTSCTEIRKLAQGNGSCLQEAHQEIPSPERTPEAGERMGDEYGEEN